MSAEELRSIIVCFLFDGTDKYVRMTLNAVNSFINTTPHIRVGLLFPHGYDETIVTQQLADPSRAAVRRYETHFQNWNPTQHKLDIIKFSDEYDTVFWLDSDAIVYQDLTDLLWKFHVSTCKVAFMKDHVCYNPQFLNVWLDWRRVSDPFIPQASFMGFKKDIMPSFFKAWEETWRKWIEPVPFLNYPNPVPSFAGSAFCTEQYALGMVLESDLVTRADVYELRRITFPLKGVSFAGGNGALANSSASSLDFSWSSFSYSERAASENELALLEEKFRRQLSFSSWGSFSQTSWTNETSWGQTSWGETSWAPTSWGPSSWNETSWSPTSFHGVETSFSFSSWSNVYPEFSFSFSSWESPSFSGSFDFSRTSGSFDSFSFGSSGRGGFWIPVDNIEGRIVHFYSTFYDQSQAWWQKNSTDVIPHINNYWDTRSQRPAYVVVPPPTSNTQRPTTTTSSPNYYHYQQQPQQQRVSPPPQVRRDDYPGL
jgi:hypothetical protein